MFTSCTHTLESGKTCQSPAIHGTDLCFHHTPHEEIKRHFPHESEPFELPKMHSKSQLVIAISEVLERMSLRRIKRSDARVFLHGFGLSFRVMTELDREVAAMAAQSDPFAESESESEAIQQTLDEIAAGLGVEMPTLKEMQKLQASMPNGTPQKALDHWISTGRIRPRRPDGVSSRAKMAEHHPGRECPHAAASAASSSVQPIRN